MRLSVALLLLTGSPALADPPPPPNPFAQCEAAIAEASRLPALAPRNLVASIARVESGRLDGASSRVRPWPWTINVEGVGHFFDSKAEVIAAVQTLQAAGTRSIDVGCMQVNLMYHPRAFATLDDAFDPATNARYAVRFLLDLYGLTHDWGLATAYYHSSTPERGEQYQQLVFGRVMTPMGATPARPPATGATLAAIPPASTTYRALAPRPVQFGGIPLFSPLAAAPTTQAPRSPSVAFGHGR